MIDGMKVERPPSKLFLSVVPKNGIILNQDFGEQSMNFAIHLKTESGQDKTYRFEIKRLPTQIVPNKTRVKFEREKVTIHLTKKGNEPWQTYKDSDFETIHLVKN